MAKPANTIDNYKKKCIKSEISQNVIWEKILNDEIKLYEIT